ncbi:MAG TPA: WYL domain-containing protein [Actinomycetota bacterium]|nr:WYL domain-containing protein [Actinomycetota bacterium]
MARVATGGAGGTAAREAAAREAAGGGGRGEARARRARERQTARTSERLRRLLVVVPYLVRHPGTRVDEVCRLFGVTERELLEDLNLLFVSGLPPYGPGDLIDVQVEGGRVWIRMADYFSRPVRLTRSEALALYLRGKALLGAPGLEEAPALASALAKIEERMGRETLQSLAGRVEVGAGGHTARALAAVRRAVARRERLEVDYYTAARDELTTRRIDPEHVFSALGNWYVVAWDHRSGEERLFRADRIRAVRVTGERFQPRGLAGPGRPLYTRTERDIPVRLLLRPGARWVAEYYATESRAEREDGALEVVLPTKDLPWVAKLVLRLGGEAQVIEPPELRSMVRDVARRTLQLYRRAPS